MSKRWPLFLALAFLLGPVASQGGDEDARKNSPAAPAPAPEPMPLPEEVEMPDASLGQEPELEAESPLFEDESAPKPPARAKSRAKPRAPFDPDRNVDYSELLGMVAVGEPGRGVLPPAPGFRGYRPNMVALGVGDRTPGYGGIVEYSWNRLALGAFFSYRRLHDLDLYSESQGFGGAYGLYRWLPWGMSPYFLLGLELGSGTPETFGGLAGAGVEARIYSGWTILLGYTYHSTVRKGFMGGAFGWSF